jgi:hypothetical protein
MGFGLIGCLAGYAQFPLLHNAPQASLRRGFFCTEIESAAHFAAAVGARHYGEVHRAFQTNRDVTEFGERLEVASRLAAKI